MHRVLHTAAYQHVDPFPDVNLYFRVGRGGGKSGDHVDVLGNYGLLDILLSVAAGRYEEVEEKVVSNIDDIAAKIPF